MESRFKNIEKESYFGHVNNNRVVDDVITHDKIEYSSHTLAEVVDGKHNNDWILIMRSRTGQ